MLTLVPREPPKKRRGTYKSNSIAETNRARCEVISYRTGYSRYSSRAKEMKARQSSNHPKVPILSSITWEVHIGAVQVL